MKHLIIAANLGHGRSIKTNRGYQIVRWRSEQRGKGLCHGSPCTSCCCSCCRKQRKNEVKQRYQIDFLDFLSVLALYSHNHKVNVSFLRLRGGRRNRPLSFEGDKIPITPALLLSCCDSKSSIISRNHSITGIIPRMDGEITQ